MFFVIGPVKRSNVIGSSTRSTHPFSRSSVSVTVVLWRTGLVWSTHIYTLLPHLTGPRPEYIPYCLTGLVPALSIYHIILPHRIGPTAGGRAEGGSADERGAGAGQRPEAVPGGDGDEAQERARGPA
eukprot:2982950-Pyramimonas_sp.AAC.1